MRWRNVGFEERNLYRFRPLHRLNFCSNMVARRAGRHAGHELKDLLTLFIRLPATVVTAPHKPRFSPLKGAAPAHRPGRPRQLAARQIDEMIQGDPHLARSQHRRAKP